MHLYFHSAITIAVHVLFTSPEKGCPGRNILANPYGVCVGACRKHAEEKLYIRCHTRYTPHLYFHPTELSNILPLSPSEDRIGGLSPLALPLYPTLPSARESFFVYLR